MFRKAGSTVAISVPMGTTDCAAGMGVIEAKATVCAALVAVDTATTGLESGAEKAGAAARAFGGEERALIDDALLYLRRETLSDDHNTPRIAVGRQTRPSGVLRESPRRLL